MLNEICSRVADRLDDLLDELGVGLRQGENKYTGCCPVHGGDNPGAFYVFPDGEQVKGFWGCYTKSCHEHFRRSLLGFTRGVLSRRQLRWDWREPGANMVKHEASVDYLLKFLGLPIEDIKYDASRVSNEQFLRDVAYLTSHPPGGRPICDREEFRRRVAIPADYYLSRGYSRNVLDDYDIGLCRNPESRLLGRVLVPVYDEDGTMVIGGIGRSIHPQCESCRLFHGDTPCPEGDARGDACKWMCSPGFVDKYHLYNFWRARPHIFSSGCVVVVEGPGDVWRLEESGVHNSVAILGAELTDVQRGRFEAMSISWMIVATDMDDAGQRAAQTIEARCGHLANITRLELPRHDAGEMTTDEIRQHFLPVVLSKSRKN